MNTLASFLMVGVLSLGVAYGLQLPRNKKSSQIAIPNPHHHARGEDVLKEVAPEIKTVEARVPENAELQNLLLNKSKRFSSFTVTTEDGLERIFVRQVLIPNRSDKVYEIQGVACVAQPAAERSGVGR